MRRLLRFSSRIPQGAGDPTRESRHRWGWCATALIWLTGLAQPILGAPAVEALAAGFKNPPDSARPWVNWFWLDGNITREGITADLEAMQRVGLGGVLLMDVSQQIPAGPVKFNSPAWHELFQHTVREASRLGLKVSLHNAPGWSGSGGPWVTPALAMQQLVWSKTNLAGPQKFAGILPALNRVCDYSRDVAVLAFPTLPGDGAAVPGFAPAITASSGATGLTNLLDGRPETVAHLPTRGRGQSASLLLEFPEPFTAQRLILRGTGRKQSVAGILEIAEDGRKFRQLREFNSEGNDVALNFEEVSARAYRVTFNRTDPKLTQLEFSEAEIYPVFRIELAGVKSGLSRGTWPIRPSRALPPYAAIRRDSMVDLTEKTDSDGRLKWDVPAGNWTVLRLGYTPLGTTNHPTPAEGLGLECDKLSREALGVHFTNFLGRLITECGPAAGEAFAGTHIDSWEIGFQNWTPKFREEFRARRGYDPVPCLPAFTGRIVESLDLSERFLWDVRRTIADLLADNYAAEMERLSREHGLQLSIEAYANGPFDILLYASRATVPMSEFWLEATDYAGNQSSRNMAAASHVYGKPVVAAEAFTAYPVEAKWQNHPFSLKPLGDAALCDGVNRLVFHRYAHQPWLNRVPGMTMGPWGVHYERTETWWELSGPWHEYLARCQFLLQQGHFAADVCYVTGEGAYNTPPARGELQPPLPIGYEYDVAPPEAVRTRMSVHDGQIVLPDGMSYQVLVLPPSEQMTPELIRKLKELVEAGAWVVGSPPRLAPGLTDYPACDTAVAKLAAEVWGDCDGKRIKEHSLGKGKVFWGTSLSEILVARQLPPDFEQLEPIDGRPLRWIHRRIADEDFYFIANSNQREVNVSCRFRVAGKRPELWLPENGAIERPTIWREEGARTVLRVRLDPGGSVFVAWRAKPAGLENAVSIINNGADDKFDQVLFSEAGEPELWTDRPGARELLMASGQRRRGATLATTQLLTIKGPWDVTFPPPPAGPGRLHWDDLISWHRHPDAAVRHYSGATTYSAKFQLANDCVQPDRRLRLDLGQVAVIARVRLNGADAGILWKPPFAADVTGLAKVGENRMEITVVNLWPNRLIGDEQLPLDCEWLPATSVGGERLGAWPSWLLAGKLSPSGRSTFTTWRHWHKDDALLESGLIGPVRLEVMERVSFPQP